LRRQCANASSLLVYSLAAARLYCWGGCLKVAQLVGIGNFVFRFHSAALPSRAVPGAAGFSARLVRAGRLRHIRDSANHVFLPWRRRRRRGAQVVPLMLMPILMPMLMQQRRSARTHLGGKRVDSQRQSAAAIGRQIGAIVSLARPPGRSTDRGQLTAQAQLGGDLPAPFGRGGGQLSSAVPPISRPIVDDRDDEFDPLGWSSAGRRNIEPRQRALAAAPASA
jgi:hypothetical protein